MPTENGKCEVCDLEPAVLVEATSLSDLFDLVCGIYETGEDGKWLVDWLIDDWAIFNVDRAAAQILLAEILDDGQRVRLNFIPKPAAYSDSLDSWNKLRDELRNTNRFFPASTFNKQHFSDLLNNLSMHEEDIPADWYRSRIEEDGGTISIDHMGAPPSNKATAGRANPLGIPYLYVASNEPTALSEVRPHSGHRVSVAHFFIDANKVNLIDLRNPRRSATPFSAEETEQVAHLRSNMEFLIQLGKELSTPVLPNTAAIDYIPSQYLCEFIKNAGYDGVVYESSTADGINLALFDLEKASIQSVKSVCIDQVNIISSDLSE